MLDQWTGKIIDSNTIKGTSNDEDDTCGDFKMTRIK